MRQTDRAGIDFIKSVDVLTITLRQERPSSRRLVLSVATRRGARARLPTVEVLSCQFIDSFDSLVWIGSFDIGHNL